MPGLSVFRSRFFWRMYSAFALLFLGITVLVSAVAFYKIKATIGEIVRENLQARAELLIPEAREVFRRDSAAAGTDSFCRPPEDAHSVLHDLGARTDTRVTIIRADGLVLADSDHDATTMENHFSRPEVQEAFADGSGAFAQRPSQTLGTTLLYYAKAVRKPDGTLLGVVRVAVPTEVLHVELDNLRLAMSGIAFIGVLLALALGWTIARRVAIPIREMVQVAEAMRAGRYGYKVRTITDDELGRLGASLNRLGSELTNKISELHRLETVRRDFVANVSHEIKTPLTSIKGYVETLLEGAVDEPEHSRRFLEKIERNSERLSNLVQDLLSLAKIEAEEDELKLSHIEWAEVMSSVLARNEDAIQQKNLRIKTNTPSAPVLVLGEREAMTQVLDNLLTNAIKYTPGGGLITLTISAKGGVCKLEVEDTGIGIPPEHLGRIFERFYRVDKARSRELGGTGLGLSIVKHLTAAMHGEVQVESTVGVGSRFTVKLQVAN